MIEWEQTSSGLRAVDAAGTTIEVRTEDWRFLDRAFDVSRPVDATVTGEATALQFGKSLVRITNLRTERVYELGNEIGPIELSDDPILINASLPIKTYVRFDGSATVSKSSDYRRVTISFPTPTRVTIGFRSTTELPMETLGIPPTPEGLAVGLSHAHASIKTTTPDRSYPTLRGHPPLFERGDSIDVPEPIENGVDETDIELGVPPDFETLFVVAPLAYYLQAAVTIEERERPVLSAPEAGIEREIGGQNDLQCAVSSLLQTLFFLDCLVRNEGPHGTNLHEARVLDDLPIDAAAAYDAPPDERLAAYLSVPRERLETVQPDWHLATYVEPAPERIGSLPYLLDRLSLVFLPATTELTGKELIDRSLNDFFRNHPGAGEGGDSVATVDIVKADLQDSKIHGWLAPGTPIDVFKATHEAFENRLDYLDEGRDTTQVEVVLNDYEMGEEHDEVAQIYREQSADLPIEVSVRECVTRDELAAVFEASNDFVHYIGHCETDGLCCPDGNFSLSELDECNAQTFFLNACGSYYEGMELIRKGSVVGAITFQKVLNEHAAKVGTTFARLLVSGYSFERSLQLARRRIMMGKDYAVVGDGTHSLVQHAGLVPPVLELESIGEDQFRVTDDTYSTSDHGGYFQVHFVADDSSYLYGNEAMNVVSWGVLQSLLDETVSPVIYENSFYWPEELREELARG